MTKNIYKEIEPPIVLFHQINNKFINKLSKLIFDKEKFSYEYHLFDDEQKEYIVKINKLTKNNLIIFENDNINILNVFRLFFHNNEMKLKIIGGVLDSKSLIFLNKIYENWGEISLMYYQYYTMFHRISHGYDNIPNKFINQLMIKFANVDRKYFQENMFLLPFKHRVTNNFPGLINKLNEYEIFIKFNLENQKNSQYSFSIYLVHGHKSKVSNEVNLIVNEEIFRPEEIDKIGRGSFTISESKEFIKNLFIYGNIKNIIECQ